MAGTKTLVVQTSPPPLEEVLQKFEGRHTARTLAAARRIQAQSGQVKIPSNIIKKLEGITGGWRKVRNPASSTCWTSKPERARVVQLTPEAEIHFCLGCDKPCARIFWHGAYTCGISRDYWVDSKRVLEAAENIGQPPQ